MYLDRAYGTRSVSLNEVILIGSSALGAPDEKLGHLLLGNFLRILGDKEHLPKYIILWNGGVKTAAADADTLEHLKKLEERGVKIILCRTCVEYYGLEDSIAVGEIDGMSRIIDLLSEHHVLTI